MQQTTLRLKGHPTMPQLQVGALQLQLTRKPIKNLIQSFGL